MGLQAEVKYCKRCGLVVADAEVHVKWHDKIDALEKKVEEAFLYGASALEQLEGAAGV